MRPNRIKQKISKKLRVKPDIIRIIEENKTGINSRVYIVQVGTKRVVYKRRINKPQLKNNTERIVLRLLGSKSILLAPRLLARERRAIIQEFVDGRKPTTNPADFRKIAEAFRATHQITFPKYGTFGKGKQRKKGTIRDQFRHYFKTYNNFVSEPIEFFSEFKGTRFVDDWLPKIQRAIGFAGVKMKDYLDDSECSLVHMDLHKDNILIERNKSRFIDWENAQIGDPAADLATYLNLTRLSDRSLSEFFSIYGAKERPKLMRRVRLYRILLQSYRILTFANAIRGRWGPRMNMKTLRWWFIINLEQFGRLTQSPISRDQAKVVVDELLNKLENQPSAIA